MKRFCGGIAILLVIGILCGIFGSCRTGDRLSSSDADSDREISSQSTTASDNVLSSEDTSSVETIISDYTSDTSERTSSTTFESVGTSSNNHIVTPCIVETVYPTDDVVVADYIVTNSDFGADSTGVRDSTQAIQKALQCCSSNGGGTVWMPVGTYRITGSITIPAFATLRGDWQDPDDGDDYGTIILADIASTAADDTTGLFYIGGSAGAMGLTVYYPHQDINNVQPYPYTFYVTGQGDGYMLQSIVNCTVINGYKGIGACVGESNAHEMMTVENFKGTFLSRGAVAYNQADVGSWKNVSISNAYWANAGAGLKAADRTALDAYTSDNTIGLMLGDLEWTEFANVFITNCTIGVQIVKGKRIEFAGSLYDVTIEGCGVGLQVDSIDTRWGMLVARSSISGSIHSVVNNTDGLVKMAGTALSGSTSGNNITQDDTGLNSYAVNYAAVPTKPKATLYVVSADKTGTVDVTDVIQQVLDTASATGGVVYLPAGKYCLDGALTVPAGVELRGSSSVATRDQIGNSNGTLILAHYGLNAENPDTDTALVTLNAGAGVRGIRFIYPENTCVRPNALGTVQTCSYTIRGNGSGVYAVNVAIGASYNGIDFRGCNNHFIKKLISCCYNTVICAGNCSGGVIEGCLQNGTVITRSGLSLANWVDESTQLFPYLFNAVTRVNTNYIKLSDTTGETILNSFAYGVKSFLENSDSTDLLLFNIGSDNLGGAMIITDGGGAAIINMMRYNGLSYTNNGTTLTIVNRLTINDENEKTVE